ncbi:hemolysin-III related-domain-containing protein [Delphinella strobiligena]|nr:hemolysin-III related-domain-containing protein [Delphinella strobiligena]
MSRRRQNNNQNRSASLTEQVKTNIQQVETNVQNALTVLWNEIPSWQQDNRYITSGYRPPTNSYTKSAASLGYLHNETVNIYTHLMGALASVAGCLWFYHLLRPRYDYASAEDVVMFCCFFAGAASCLGMSATYHTISNHSQSVNRIGNQLDYVGIVCLIWGSFIPSIFYGFYTDPNLRWTYWFMITLIAAGCVTLSVNPKFRTSEWRPFRAAMFVAMGLSAVIPIIHGVFLYGVTQLQVQMGLSWVVSQGVLYILGAAIYAARIPEKLRPGAFDIWGSSHQIFHVLVLMAAATHLVGLLKAFDYEHSRRASFEYAFHTLKHSAGL